MLTVGTYLADRYEIVGKIGTGGMSDVYKAKDHILGRFVAVKVLKAEFSEDRSFVTKFRTEAQSAAGLEHPNIVNIYDVGSEEGLYYIVMEYVEGITLKTYIEKKGQLSFKEATSIAIQVARGIEAAHNKKITHRDIKPQNIIISTEGKVKVTDFGIARAASSNTISSDVMGSVHYSSPEQARNGFVDGRSDIYSLGIVMYEMVTGRVPFDGDTTVAVAIQHLQEEMVEPSVYAQNLPISMEKIILKCTQKNADRRYQDIADLLNDLRKALVSPDEDFVVIATAIDNGKTKVISGDEIRQIKERGIEPEPEKAEPELQEEYEEEPEDDEDEEGLSPKLDKAVTIMGIVVAAVILIVIIYLLGSVFGLFRSKDSADDRDSESQQTESQIDSQTEPDSEEVQPVIMIDLLNKTKEEAQEALDQIGLYMFVIQVQKSDKPAGTILNQDITAGTPVTPGTTVNVIIAGTENQDFSGGENSDNTTSVTVQNVVGYMEADAVKTISDQKLNPQKKYEYSDTVDAGKVIRQSPAGGSQATEGSIVTLTISQGRQSVVVPSVLNESAESAENKLRNQKLEVKIEEAYDDSVEAGRVIRQSVASGKTVPAGTVITITVSLGKEIINYSFSNTYSAPADAVSVSYSLVGSDGVTYASGTNEDVDGSITISAEDMPCSSGTVSITWTIVTVDEEGVSGTTETPESHSVEFTKQ